MKRVIAVLAGVAIAGVAVSADPAASTGSAAGATVATAPVASSAPLSTASAQALVKYREGEMSLIGKHMKAARLIATGEVARPQDLVRHAEGLHAESMDLVAQFPEGTGPDKVKTEAKAEVWTKRAEFEAAAKKLQDASAKLVEVAKTGDLAATKTQLDAVGDTCGGCHDTFKVKD